eukprot:scaffold45030_cov80-Phaeocystis_antarctica.AAC.1
MHVLCTLVRTVGLECGPLSSLRLSSRLRRHQQCMQARPVGGRSRPGFRTCAERNWSARFTRQQAP